MKSFIKKGVSILFVYLLIFLFTISLTNRIEKLENNGVKNNVGVEILK